MKTTLKTLLIASALILPVTAYAGHEGKPESKMEGMQMCTPEKCPMADQMGEMQTKTKKH
jgi:hypothetical protein